MSRYIDADFMEKHYASMLINPTPDVTEQDKKKAQIIITALNMERGIDIDRPQGEWEEKTTFHNEDDNPIIKEWQSAKCSVCGKYHTTPYLYYFDDFNFCPNCGARMKGADDECEV